MRIQNTLSRLAAILIICCLAACAAHKDVTRSLENPGSNARETAELADIAADALNLAKQLGKDKVLVVFDIDNTILAMEQGLGADQWYEWQKELANSDLCNPRNVGNRLAVQGALYFASAMRPTQRDAAGQVASIQAAGIPVIALTSRGTDFRLQTFRELRRNGFSFTHSAIGRAGGFGEPFIPIENGRETRYEDGVYLTAGQHKGQMLYALLQKTGTALPAVIVMADDKQKNLDAVKETFDVLEVPVHAWRYTGEDQNVAGFDPEKADAEWKSIKDALWQIQRVFGPDNYDITSAKRPPECP